MEIHQSSISVTCDREKYNLNLITFFSEVHEFAIK